MNAVSRARFDRRLVQELFGAGGVSSSIVRCNVPVCVWRWRIAMRRGRELMRV